MSTLISLYANSFVEIINKNDMVKIKNELAELLLAFQDLTSEFNAAKYNESLSNEIISAIAHSKKISSYTCNLLKVLAYNKRLDLVSKIFIESINIINNHLGIKKVKITLATQVHDKTKENLEKNISKILQNEIEVEYNIDPLIIGGLKICFEGIEYDASVAEKINSFKKSVFNQIEQIN